MDFKNQEKEQKKGNNRFCLTKKRKIKMLLNYAKECYKKGNKPTKREIRKNFHLEIYNYFKNIADYHEKAGINVSLRNYPKEKGRFILTEYIKQKAKTNYFPNRREIEQKFKIHMRTYFKNLKELYDNANINYLFVEKAIKDKILASHQYSKNFLDEQKRNIKDFIQKNISNGFYPSVQHIQKTLNLSFYNLYKNIFDAYKDAGVDYERPSPIILGKKKEKVFTKIIKDLLVKMNFQIKRISIESKTNFNRLADITVEDKERKISLVEIKAYRKDYHISKRQFEQLLSYLKKEKVSKGIFITTSKTKKCEFKNIWYINGDNIIKLLKKYGLQRYIKSVKWIQDARVNSKERELYKKIMKIKILDYIYTKSIMPTKREIENTFHVNIRSFFGKTRPFEKLLKEVKKIKCLHSN